MLLALVLVLRVRRARVGRALMLALSLAGGCVCGPGEAACDGQCMTFEDDDANCGGCGVACRPGSVCVGTECVAARPPGRLCSNDGDCDDRDPCTGVERCIGGACRSGTPLDCNDGLSCTQDLCAPEHGGCVIIPRDSLCGRGHCTAIGAPGDTGCGD